VAVRARGGGAGECDRAQRLKEVPWERPVLPVRRHFAMPVHHVFFLEKGEDILQPGGMGEGGGADVYI